MADDFDYMAHPYGVKIIGPFVAEYRLTVRDFRVPYMSAFPMQDGSWNLVCDERFMIECTDDELRKWLPYLADAMAVAAGFSSFGENARPVNPFAVRMSALGPDDLKPDEGKGQSER